MGNWLGDSEDTSKFMSQIQHFSLCVCSIASSLLFKALALNLYTLFPILIFPSLFLLLPFMIKLLFPTLSYFLRNIFLFALQHTNSCRKHFPVTDPFYSLLIIRWPAITCSCLLICTEICRCLSAHLVLNDIKFSPPDRSPNIVKF